MLYAIMFA